jgi:hypothetical protein
MPGYLGDTKKMIVHHLANMKMDCKIYDININNRKYFTPDSLEKAKSEGFSPCKLCN